MAEEPDRASHDEHTSPPTENASGTTYGNRREPSLGADGDDAPLPPWVASDPDPNAEPSAYHGDEVLPAPAVTTGRYQFVSAPPSTHPTDPVLPFIAPPVPRRRRSDWPVLLGALAVAAVVMAVCCVAGYVLYSSKGSPLSF